MKTIADNQAFLTGNRIYLRGMEKGDYVDGLYRWRNDPEVTNYMVQGLKPSNKDLLQEEYLKEIKDESQVLLAIVDKATGKHIGNTGLHSINWIGRTAEFRIIIGEKEFWGKGIGTEVTKLVLKYAFEKLNLEKVWLGVTNENTAAYNCYLKAGFVKEGVLRRTWFRNNKYYDDIRMGILKEEYNTQNKCA